MKYTLCLLSAAAILAGMCTGCKKETTETPATPEAVKAAAKDWAPETATPAHDPNDGGDHSGHNH